ncbi:hypothetical protein QDQ38_02615 [Citrobacter portucalensis]|uniref:hypothetical protein n=1 Tax=Citrobacter portucalensis TaxID=1639133 RepID=UPI003360EAC1
MQNKKSKTILRFAFLVFFTSMLSGCTLTRVSDSSHAKEIQELNVIGLSLESARKKATEKGFVCSEYGNVNTVVTDDGEHRWLQARKARSCSARKCVLSFLMSIPTRIESLMSATILINTPVFEDNTCILR